MSISWLIKNAFEIPKNNQDNNSNVSIAIECPTLQNITEGRKVERMVLSIRTPKSLYGNWR
jgi:hypothetical protein